MLVAILSVAFAASVLICIGESIAERDWPRDTWRFPVVLVILLIGSLA